MILMIVLSRVASIDFLERVEISIVAIGEAYMCTMERSTPFFLFMYITFDVDIHRPKKARGNEKDKLPSGVGPRSNDQQTSTLDTEP